jgi:hypothetical protein
MTSSPRCGHRARALCSWRPVCSDAIHHFGLAGGIPVISHSRGRIGVFRGGAWILDTNGNPAWEPGDVVVQAGRPTDRPLFGEW